VRDYELNTIAMTEMPGSEARYRIVAVCGDHERWSSGELTKTECGKALGKLRANTEGLLPSASTDRVEGWNYGTFELSERDLEDIGLCRERTRQGEAAR